VAFLRYATEQKRADVRWERDVLEPARLVFVEETCASAAMLRLRGRGPRASISSATSHKDIERASLSWRRPRPSGMTVPFVLDGAMNGPMPLAVKQCPAPTLKRGVVIMDNLPMPKITGVRRQIKELLHRRLNLLPIRPT
jgi:hypothetical protein